MKLNPSSQKGKAREINVDMLLDATTLTRKPGMFHVDFPLVYE